MSDGERRTVITTRCGRRIVVSHTGIPTTAIRWVTVRISSEGTADHIEWISLNQTEAAALGAALLAHATS